MSMKIKVLIVFSLLVLNVNLLRAQNSGRLDLTRILYIYQFVTNHYLTSAEFWASRASVYRNYKISDSEVILSSTSMDFNELDSFLVFFSIDTIDEELNVFNKFDLSEINSLFKVKVDSTLGKVPDSLICSSNCRAYIRFTDIFKKENKYFVGMIGYANMDDKVFLTNDILFEFEVCKKNGYLNFMKIHYYLGRSNEDFINNSFHHWTKKLKSYNPCNPDSIKNINEPLEYNDKKDTIFVAPTKINKIIFNK